MANHTRHYAGQYDSVIRQHDPETRQHDPVTRRNDQETHHKDVMQPTSAIPVVESQNEIDCEERQNLSGIRGPSDEALPASSSAVDSRNDAEDAAEEELIEAYTEHSARYRGSRNRPADQQPSNAADQSTSDEESSSSSERVRPFTGYTLLNPLLGKRATFLHGMSPGNLSTDRMTI